MEWFQFETTTSSPYTHAGQQFRVHSWVLRILFPGMGGMIWNYPVAMTIRTGEDNEKRIPILDTTRLAQIALLGISLLGIILLGSKRT